MGILKQRLWLTTDGARVVPDGDPDAVYLLGAVGQEIDEKEAKRLKLTKDQYGPAEPQATMELGVKAQDAPEETKAELGPQSTKDTPKAAKR